MMFLDWKIGLDIQIEGIRAIAVKKCRQGLQLCHWWDLTFPSEAFNGYVLSQPGVLLKVLDSWRKQLPRRYRLSVSFPAQRTFQSQVPISNENLSEAVQEDYIAYTTAQQLQMSTSHLCYDYIECEGMLSVTSARHSDISDLLSCLSSVKLFPNVVTPCDKVLCALPVECYPKTCQYLIHEEPNYWLWASCRETHISGWQDKSEIADFSTLTRWLGGSAEHIAFSTACVVDKPFLGVQSLDVWGAIARLYPPLPQIKGRYTIALGLVLGDAD